MKKADKNILLAHGGGGEMMHNLIESVFIKSFRNEFLNEKGDAAVIRTSSDEIAFTTDSFVIDPLFFPGGDIGKLSVCGTVNDLAVSGAEPLWLSASFIIEEGFPLSDLETIAESMAAEASKAGVFVVTGDTKVVNRGKCDKLFINTSGIGKIREKNLHIHKACEIVPGDLMIINGMIGDHGMAVMNARESFNFRAGILSDCACLNHLIMAITERTTVKFMRDPTRGGVASVLNELAAKMGMGIAIDERSLPVRDSVSAMCEILGLDPLNVANEGKVIIVAAENSVSEILEILKSDELGRNSAVIGKVVRDHPGKVVMNTIAGGRRFVETLQGDQLPRIC